jgi:hypothetical protein
MNETLTRILEILLSWQQVLRNFCFSIFFFKLIDGCKNLACPKLINSYTFSKDFQKVSSTVQEFLLKLPDEEASARLRDNLLQALHLLQLYYRDLQKRDKENDPLQWTIDHSLSPLTPFKDAPDKFDWQWVNIDSTKARQSLTRTTKLDSFTSLPSIIVAIREGDIGLVKQLVKEGTC